MYVYVFGGSVEIRTPTSGFGDRHATVNITDPLLEFVYQLVVSKLFTELTHCKPATDIRYISKYLGQLANHIWLLYTNKQNLAETVRFELTAPFGTTVFKTVALNQTRPHFHYLVPPKGLEPSHLAIPEPKSGASTNFAKGAMYYLYHIETYYTMHRRQNYIFRSSGGVKVRCPDYAFFPLLAKKYVLIWYWVRESNPSS